MRMNWIDRLRGEPAAAAALAIFALSSATILGAYYFELVLKLPPCPLCLEERLPYVVVIPLSMLMVIAALSIGMAQGAYDAALRYSKLRKQGVMGSILVTDRRLLVWANHVKHVNVPHHDLLRAGIKVTVDQPDWICVSYDAGARDPGMSGQVEVRLRTIRASTIAWLCRDLAAR